MTRQWRTGDDGSDGIRRCRYYYQTQGQSQNVFGIIQEPATDRHSPSGPGFSAQDAV